MKTVLKKAIALFAVLMLLSCLTSAAFADTTNAAVNDAANGTMRINLGIVSDTGTHYSLGIGSCFLINENTVITNGHCVKILDDFQLYEEGFISDDIPDLDAFEKKYTYEYSVTVTRDVTVKATLTQMSSEMDFAILTLDTPIKNREVLSLRDSSTVKMTENVYAIGFPAAADAMQTTTTANTSDVTITKGTVSKVTRGLNTWTAGSVEMAGLLGVSGDSLGYQECDLILSDCTLSGGNSGGPMVDEDGAVIGICEGSYGDKYFYTIPINLVTEVCDALGIAYTKAGAESAPQVTEAPAAAPEATAQPEAVSAVDASKLEKAVADAKAIAAEGYTEASYKSLTDAIAVAEGVLATSDPTQSSVDAAAKSIAAAMSALEQKKGMSTSTILIIVAAVAVVAVAAIVLAVVSGNKKKAKVTAAAAVAPAASAATTPMSAAAETSILTKESGATTVLVHGGTLTRIRTGQTIELNSAEITIGREAKNTYAIKDVPSISRNHAKISTRSRVAYLKDLGAANGTTINGVRLNPNQEQALKDKDRICFAEEEFEYRDK